MRTSLDTGLRFADPAPRAASPSKGPSPQASPFGGIQPASVQPGASPSRPPRRAIQRAALALACLLAVLLQFNCSEFTHMGRISDREYASPVAGVKIEQQNEDGTWRKIGETDGAGKWWIMKNEYKGGGRVRLSKVGYGTQVMSDNEFLQASSLLMVPESADESNTNAPWR